MRSMTPEKFWKRVEKTDTCWLWRGPINSDGYGAVGMNFKTIRAHRAAWIYTNGSIPDGLWVLHRCDTPLCVRPDHLFLGTAKDNADDRDSKGHGYSGSQHHLSKLDDDKIRQIRKLHSEGISQRVIAKKFGITQPNVGYITRGETWRHV